MTKLSLKNILFATDLQTLRDKTPSLIDVLQELQGEVTQGAAPVDGVRATLVADSAAANSDLTFTAVGYGTAAHRISVEVLAGDTDTVLGVTVREDYITIQLAEAGNTAAEVKAAYDAVADAVARATVAVEGTGAGAVTAKARASLAGGVDVTPGLVIIGAGYVYLRETAQVWKKIATSSL